VLTHRTLNLFSLIGTILLIGISTKNGILLVDYANTLRERGKKKLDAILESAHTRFRPIIMTSFSVVAGNIPLALALDPGSISRSSLGIVVIGGVVSSLVLTLLLIPNVYMWVSPSDEKFSREFKKPGLELSEEAKERLLHYRWPGNVRELQNTMERAVILTDGLSITADGLQLPATKPDADLLPAGMLPEQFSWEGSLEEVTGRAVSHIERVLLESTLRECKWNKTRASEKLGVSPKTLLAKLRGAGLEE